MRCGGLVRGRGGRRGLDVAAGLPGVAVGFTGGAGTLPTSSMFRPFGSFTNTLRIVGLHSTSLPSFEITRTPAFLSFGSSLSIAATRIAMPDAPGSGTRRSNGLPDVPWNSII